MTVEVSAHSLNGNITVPGSKSQTIRACLFAAIAHGISNIHFPLCSLDCISALKAIEKLGCKILSDSTDVWTITSSGLLTREKNIVIDCGNSGTLYYLLIGISATLQIPITLTGDDSLIFRPVDELLDVYQSLGATVQKNNKQITVLGPIHSGNVRLRGNLSQYVSSMLIAGSLTEGTTHIELDSPQELPYIRMTIDWLQSSGCNVLYAEDYKTIEVTGKKSFNSFDCTIPSDWESAAFPISASLVTGSEITINNVDVTYTQGDISILDIFCQMGAKFSANSDKTSITVIPPKKLKPVKADLSNIPDSLPILAVTASFADGISEFTNLSVCRMKETDRIKCIRTELEKLGVKIEENKDRIKIFGTLQPNATPIHGAKCTSYFDHRIAMALAVFGLALPENEKLILSDAECSQISYPDFYKAMNALGAGFKQTIN